MSRGQRLALLAFAAVIAIAAVVVLGPAQQARDREPSRTGASPRPATPERGGVSNGASPPAPEPPTIRLRGGKPVGGIEEITVKSGERVRFSVRSDERAQLHIHGFDRYVNLVPGKTAPVAFRADLEGIFEIEEHATKAEVASLKVVP